MRHSIGAVLFVAVLAGCSSGGRTLTAPTSTRTAPALRVIPPFLPTSAPPDSVTRFPCPTHPASMIDLQSCSGRRILALNARVNERIEIIWYRLRDATGRRYFVKAERAWQTYLENECRSRSRAWTNPASPHLYVGGTLAPVRVGICEEELTAAHLRELAKTAAWLAPH